MRQIASRGAVTLLTTALLAGCGGVHGIPIDQTAKDIARTVCSKAWVCCSVDQLKNNSSAGTSVVTDTTTCTTDVAPCEKECEVKTAEDFRNQLADIQRSVDQKRAVYEETKVEACLGTIREGTCDNLNMTTHLTGVPGCDSFVTPLVGMGGTCSHDYECTSGWCKPPASGFDGTCAAPMSGMSCAEGCGGNAVCDNLGTSNEADDVCVPIQDNGGACTTSAQCRSGNCTSVGGAATMTCQPAAVGACFYGSGCSAIGGRPGVVSLLLLTGLLGAARARRKVKARG